MYIGERLYVCEVCFFVFIILCVFKMYVCLYIGEKLYKCEECGCVFIRRDEMYIYMYIYKGELVLICFFYFFCNFVIK